MTGKEALKLAQDTILAHNGNNKSSFTMKNLYLVEKELDKYKRAFEILKEFNDLPPLEEFVYCKEENYYYAEIEEYDDNLETYKTLIYTLGKEEYELLEELMKSENC